MSSQKDVVRVVLVTTTARRGIHMNINSTFQKFHAYVMKKFNIKNQCQFVLSYNLPSSDDPIQITDDEDLSFFLDVARNMVDKPIDVFVNQKCNSDETVDVHVRSTQQSAPYTQYLTNSTAYSQPTKENGVYNSFFPHHSDNMSENDCYKYNQVVSYVAGPSETIGEDDTELNEDYAEDIDNDNVTELGSESDSDIDYGFITGEEDGDDDWSHDDYSRMQITPSEWKDNTFAYMPEPLPTPPEYFKEIILPKTDGSRKVSLAKGLWFVNKAECKKIIAHHSIQEGYGYKVRNSSTTRYDVGCIREGCDWKIANKRAKVGESFHVTSIHDTHTCSKTQVKGEHRNAGKEVLGDLLMDKMKDPKRVYTPKDIVEDIGLQYHITISYQQAWRGREAALEKLRGGHAESFNKLPYYFHNLQLKNPGTYTDIQTDQYGCFEMCFMMLGVSIRTFQNHLRPLIIVDGAHLKGKYKGSNLIAVGMDGNNQIVPLAYGICPGESGPTWTWFMMKLKHCIGEPQGLVFISDRHAGIALAINDIFPSAFHGICCRHLLMNINLPQKKDGVFWKVCKAHSVVDFDRYMKGLREVSAYSHDKLLRIDNTRWTRAHCPVNRYNYVTSNCVESVNALSVAARKMPITMVMEFFRGLVQRWSYERRQVGGVFEEKGQRLTKYAETKIYRRIRKSNTWPVYGISTVRYQVSDGRHNHLVDLERRECSCLKWSHSGLPCGHVIAVYKKKGLGIDYADLAQEFFTVATYRGTYAEETLFVGDVSNWVIPEHIQNVLPPKIIKRNAGRPKRTGRIPSRGEKVKIIVCSRCGSDDHKSAQCRISMTTTKASFSQNVFELNE